MLGTGEQKMERKEEIYGTIEDAEYWKEAYKQNSELTGRLIAMAEAQDIKSNHDADRYARKIKELTEENERLRAAIPLWAKQCVELEERCMKLRADTVREMHSMLCEGRVSNDTVVIVANQIVKEMLDNG
jgi:hypothetical protein